MRRSLGFVCLLALSSLLGIAGCADEGVTPPLNLTPNQDAGPAVPPNNPPGTDAATNPPQGCTPACGAGTTCRDGSCVPTSLPMTPTMTGAAIGAACSKNSDCGGSVCLSAKNYPQGYCSKVCGGDIVSEGNACPTGAKCFQLGEASAFCLDTCASDAECRTGYVCGSDGKDKACLPRCKASSECAQGLVCNMTSGVCEKQMPNVPPPPPSMGGRGRVGTPCMMDAQCAPGTCLDPTGSIFVGGYCVAPCTKAEVGKPCANNDGLCVDISTAMKEGYMCLGPCDTGTDCRKEYLCSVEADMTEGTGFCAPRCEHYPCDEGETCDATVGVCVKGTPATSTGAQVTHVSFGTKPVGYEDADEAVIEVDVPADAVSFSLVVKTAAPTVIGIARIYDPKGKTVFDIADPTSTDYKAYRSQNIKGDMGVLFPNAPRLNLIPGKYRIGIYAQMTTSVKIDALIKRQTGVIPGGTLPVVFWFTKTKYLTAATAQTNPAFQNTIKTLGEIFGTVGIKLGAVTYKDVTGPNAEAWALIDNLSNLGPLFANANASNERALHFFMIDQFTFEGGSTVLGISGGIPGPPAYPNLLHGGVAVALAFLDKNPDTFVETIAHEAGHYLGLWHLSERDGKAHDPLQDTPECPASNDANNDGIISHLECMIARDNLMFWSASTVRQRKITNDQRFVLLRNPSVQ